MVSVCLQSSLLVYLQALLQQTTADCYLICCRFIMPACVTSVGSCCLLDEVVHDYEYVSICYSISFVWVCVCLCALIKVPLGAALVTDWQTYSVWVCVCLCVCKSVVGGRAGLTNTKTEGWRGVGERQRGCLSKLNNYILLWRKATSVELIKQQWSL